MKFGAHMSVSGGAWRGLQRGRSIGCEVIQIFVKNILVSPMQFPGEFEVFGSSLNKPLQTLGVLKVPLGIILLDGTPF